MNNSQFQKIPTVYPCVHPYKHKQLVSLLNDNNKNITMVLNTSTRSDVSIYDIIESPIYINYDPDEDKLQFSNLSDGNLNILITGYYSLFIIDTS